MTEDQALGMMVGCAVGDAFGAPFEFKRPEQIMLRDIADDYTIGGAHNVSYGEWTDDTAMMLASAYAYAEQGGFSPRKIVRNFKKWRAGKDFGTRSYVFDIGGTTDTAIEDMTEDRPYMGQDVDFASGNGSIMRVAPAIIANHGNIYRAVADSVALSLMTHGNDDTIRYITAFSSEMVHGRRLIENNALRRWKISTDVGTGTIMHSYAVAWMAEHFNGDDFLGAMKYVVELGYDTDTNCAVTAMLLGRLYGMKCIPQQLIDGLQQVDKIKSVAKRLHKIGEVQ